MRPLRPRKCLQNSRLTKRSQQEEKISEVFVEIDQKRIQERLNRKRIGCDVIWEPSIVNKGGGELLRA